MNNKLKEHKKAIKLLCLKNIYVKQTSVGEVDPFHPVLYRSGLVFERITASQARAGCGPQNG